MPTSSGFSIRLQSRGMIRRGWESRPPQTRFSRYDSCNEFAIASLPVEDPSPEHLVYDTLSFVTVEGDSNTAFKIDAGCILSSSPDAASSGRLELTRVSVVRCPQVVGATFEDAP